MRSRPSFADATLTALGTGLPLAVVPVAVLAIPLTVSDALGLGAAERTSWILALYGLPTLVNVVLAWSWRLPVVYTGNLLALLFFVSLGEDVTYGELVGATMASGLVVAALGLTGTTARLGRWIPTPVVMGLLAGIVLPFVADGFGFVEQAPAMMGTLFGAYLLGRAVLPRSVPAVLPATAVALVVAWATGRIGPAPGLPDLPRPLWIAPEFAPASWATLVPVLVVLMTVEANVPSLALLRRQGYRAPGRALETLSGLGTVAASSLGPTCLSISLLATSLTADPRSGPREARYRVVLVASAATALIAVFAAGASALLAWLPLPLLYGVAGLALLDVLAGALRDVARGPLWLGPLFALAITVSDLSLAGFGAPFWALLVGTVAAYGLEREGLRQLWRDAGSEAHP